jgi:hypothetical protein
MPALKSDDSLTTAQVALVQATWYWGSEFWLQGKVKMTFEKTSELDVTR